MFIPEIEVKKNQRLEIQEYITELRNKGFKNIEIAEKLGTSKTISSGIYRLGVDYEISFKKAKVLLDRIRILKQQENVA